MGWNMTPVRNFTNKKNVSILYVYTNSIGSWPVDTDFNVFAAHMGSTVFISQSAHTAWMPPAAAVGDSAPTMKPALMWLTLTKPSLKLRHCLACCA